MRELTFKQVHKCIFRGIFNKNEWHKGVGSGEWLSSFFNEKGALVAYIKEFGRFNGNQEFFVREDYMEVLPELKSRGISKCSEKL